MITATLQMKKLRPTRANKVLEFKDHALDSPRDVPYALLCDTDRE